MPELPEVEITRLGISPRVKSQQVVDVIVRNANLRWKIPSTLKAQLTLQQISQVKRRGKYLLFYTSAGCVILHLGMSGTLRYLPADTPIKKHDHVDIVFANDHCIRFNDPRRFGAILWTTEDPLLHPLLANLGPEPFSHEFNADYLHSRSRKRRLAIKNFIMNSQIVVGVGNIYANEALFYAGIKPTIAAGRISKHRYKALVDAIQTILEKAIKFGGTTLRDFIASDGKPGYFAQHLNVYGKKGTACTSCSHKIRLITIGQRASYYCPHCQS